MKVNSYVGSRDEWSLNITPNHLQMTQIITDINFSTRSVESLWVLPSSTPPRSATISLCEVYHSINTRRPHTLHVTFCNAKWTIYLQYYCISSINLFFDTIYSGRFKYTSIMPINRKRKARGISKGLQLEIFTNQLVLKSNKKSEETKWLWICYYYSFIRESA